jgi:hypothetical protein
MVHVMKIWTWYSMMSWGLVALVLVQLALSGDVFGLLQSFVQEIPGLNIRQKEMTHQGRYRYGDVGEVKKLKAFHTVVRIRKFLGLPDPLVRNEKSG